METRRDWGLGTYHVGVSPSPFGVQVTWNCRVPSEPDSKRVCLTFSVRYSLTPGRNSTHPQGLGPEPGVFGVSPRQDDVVTLPENDPVERRDPTGRVPVSTYRTIRGDSCVHRRLGNRNSSTRVAPKVPSRPETHRYGVEDGRREDKRSSPSRVLTCRQGRFTDGSPNFHSRGGRHGSSGRVPPTSPLSLGASTGDLFTEKKSL